nr:hypothetical protein [Desulfobulbaceae bacterium]
MPIQPVSQRHDLPIQKYVNHGSVAIPTFANTLAKATNNNSIVTANRTGDSAGPKDIIKVGQISVHTPTVSHILRNNDDFRNNSWQIINSELNKNKQFTTMKDGDFLSINQETKELFWEKKPAVQPETRIERIQKFLGGMLKDETANVSLGTLSKTLPTISHVVRNNENIKGFHWDIIHADINKNKPYSTITQGTSVSINPKTLELVFKEPQELREKERSVFEKTKVVSVAQKISRSDILKIKLQDLTQNTTGPFILGTLSKDQTVSQLVRNNQHTRDLYKEIVYSDTNKDKPYNNLQPGTQVCIDPVTLELILSRSLPDRVKNNSAAEACPPAKTDSVLSKSEQLQQYVSSLGDNDGQPIKIGSLSRELPTVSQLLNNDQRFTGRHWDIIFSKANHGKPFQSLLPGTQVSINPENLELLLNVSSGPGTSPPKPLMQHKAEPPPEQPLPSQLIQTLQPVLKDELPQTETLQASSTYQHLATEDKATLFHDKLVSSAKQMIGRPSNEVDNYKLLLNGLKEQGIEYEGEKGLKENLGQLASLMWLNESTFHNVKGIVKIAGDTIYTKTIEKNATQEQMADFTHKMTRYLENGQIVTLSTPSIDQSGIVSNRQKEWTLINSNTMQNKINYFTGSAKMVHEAPLNQRIADLHTTASANNEDLTVTVSKLEENVLRNIDSLVDSQKKNMGLLTKFRKP